MQAVGYLVRALLLAAGNALPATLLEPEAQISARRTLKNHRARILSHAQGPPAQASLDIERQHKAFAASAESNDEDVNSRITQLSICENEIGARGVQELMILFHPSYGDTHSAHPCKICQSAPVPDTFQLHHGPAVGHHVMVCMWLEHALVLPEV